MIALTVENGRWRLDGDTVQAAAQKMEQRNDAQSNLSDKSLDAVKFVNSRESITPKDLAAHLNIDNKIAGNLLGRLASSEHIRKNHRGTYVSIGSETSESDETADDGLTGNSSPSPDSPPLDGPRLCGCGADLLPDNTTDMCRECEYEQRQRILAERAARVGGE